jgi:hypothetical protein
VEATNLKQTAFIFLQGTKGTEGWLGASFGLICFGSDAPELVDDRERSRTIYREQSRTTPAWIGIVVGAALRRDGISNRGINPLLQLKGCLVAWAALINAPELAPGIFTGLWERACSRLRMCGVASKLAPTSGEYLASDRSRFAQ